MAVAGDLVSDVSRRVRDPQNTANPKPVVWDLMDRAQVLLVRAYGVLIRERAFTHTPERCIYELDPQETLRIIDIFLADTDNEKRLQPVQWQQLFQQAGPLWWRQTRDGNPTTWANAGTKHFIVWPAPETDPVDLIIREQYRPEKITSDDVTIAIPDQNVPDLLNLTEALLYLRQRDAALGEALATVGT